MPLFLATHAFILSTFHRKSYLGFLIVRREDPRLLQKFVLELLFFYLILSRHGHSGPRVGFGKGFVGFGSFRSLIFRPNRVIRIYRSGFGSGPTGSGSVRILDSWTQQDNQSLSVWIRSDFGSGLVRVMSGPTQKNTQNTQKRPENFDYSKNMITLSKIRPEDMKIPKLLSDYRNYIFENLNFYPKSKTILKKLKFET